MRTCCVGGGRLHGGARSTYRSSTRERNLLARISGSGGASSSPPSSAASLHTALSSWSHLRVEGCSGCFGHAAYSQSWEVRKPSGLQAHGRLIELLPAFHKVGKVAMLHRYASCLQVCLCAPEAAVLQQVVDEAHRLLAELVSDVGQEARHPAARSVAGTS